MFFKDKVAIITGSSQGIGRTIARQLGRQGAYIILNGRREVPVMETCDDFVAEGIRVLPVSGDVSKEEDCVRLIENALRHFGRLDILIHNAGVGSRGFFEETQPDVFKTLLDVNVLGPVYLTRQALPELKKSKGNIVFISSHAAFRGLPNRSPYSLAKMAQTSLAESLRVELAPYGIHIGIVYVGPTESDPGKKILSGTGEWKVLNKSGGRFMDSQEEVAAMVLKNLRHRHFKTIVGLKGYLYYNLLRFFPGLSDFIFRQFLDKIKDADN